MKSIVPRPAQPAVVVQKFGGSSLATLDKLKAVAAKVLETSRRGKGTVVVVSAMGKTTDGLLAQARELSASPTARELDILLSTGERVSTALLCLALHELGGDAVALSGSQAGIITTDTHQDAQIIEIRPFRIQDELTKGKIVVVAGFQGESYRGELTTLGRGGSDTTAVALAAALGADHCDIYSDVDGVYTADPRVIDASSRLDQLCYEEMQELARLGARVLNAEAVEFARQRSIAIYARSTFGSQQHTVINRQDQALREGLQQVEADGVSGVAGRRDLILLNYYAPPEEPNRLPQLLEAIDGTCLQSANLVGAGRELQAVLSTENTPDPEALVRELSATFGSQLEVLADLGSASAVGLNVGSRSPVLARTQRALTSVGLKAIANFTTQTSVTCLVPRGQVDQAMSALHDEFLEFDTHDPTTPLRAALV